MIERISFFVAGKPIPKGSLRSFIPRWKPGQLERPMVVTKEEMKDTLTPWMLLIKIEAQRAMRGRPPFEVAVDLSIDFVMPRLKSHFDAKGMLRPDAPRWHVTRPDRDKLMRAVLDALTGILWTDDSVNCDGPVRKRYAGADETPGVHITATLKERP